MAQQQSPSEVRPGEPCEICGEPATNVLFRSANLLTDATGRVIAEVEQRAALCLNCFRDVPAGRKQLPPARIIRRFDVNDDQSG